MNNQNNGKSTASLVLGIISVVFIFTGSFSFLGMILAVIGLILGIQSQKEYPGDGKAKAGVILSIIGLALCALTFISCIACIGAFAALS